MTDELKGNGEYAGGLRGLPLKAKEIIGWHRQRRGASSLEVALPPSSDAERVAQLTPKQNETQEEKQQKIQANVQLLREALVDCLPTSGKSFEIRQRRRGISQGNILSAEDGATVKGLTIYYDTATGEIRKPAIGEKFTPGAYSRLRTWTTTDEESEENGDLSIGKANQPLVTIALFEDQSAEAISDDEEPSLHEKRILPQRLDPEVRWRVSDGKRVHWGDTYYEEDSSGDEIMVESIMEFNNQFGKKNASMPTV